MDSHKQHSKFSVRIDPDQLIHSKKINDITFNGFVIRTILLISYLLANHFIYPMYKHYLEDLDTELIVMIQTDNAVLNFVMSSMGYIIERDGIILTYTFLASFFDYTETWYIMIILLIKLYINGIQKMLYRDPRPYFIDENVNAIFCDRTYGNPSGHSMYFVSVFPIMVYMFVNHLKRDCNNSLSSKTVYTIATLSSAFVIANIIGRIYLGVHTIDQIIYGLLVGFALLWYFACVIYKPIINYVSRFAERKCTTREAICNLVVIAFVIFVLVVLSLGMYYRNTVTYDDPVEWIDAIALKCGYPRANVSKHLLSIKGTEYMTAPATTLGILLGIVFSSWFGSNNTNRVEICPLRRTLKRLVINALLCIPIAILLVISKGRSFWFVTVFSNIVPVILYTFMLTGPNKMILQRLGMLHGEQVWDPSNQSHENKTKTD